MKIILFYFEMAIKITGSAQNYMVGRVSGNRPISLRPKIKFAKCHFKSEKTNTKYAWDISFFVKYINFYAELMIDSYNHKQSQ